MRNPLGLKRVDVVVVLQNICSSDNLLEAVTVNGLAAISSQ